MSQHQDSPLAVWYFHDALKQELRGIIRTGLCCQRVQLVIVGTVDQPFSLPGHVDRRAPSDLHDPWPKQLAVPE
jgi:hypothetical protein